MKHIFLVFIALIAAAAEAGQIYADEDEAVAHCERILTSNLKSWTREARRNLAKIASYPIYPVTVAHRANGLIAQALGIKPADVDLLEHQALRASVEGDRLQLEIKDWGSFQRALVSLRQPEVIKDFSLAQRVNEDFDGFFATSVQANTRLFYPMRDLPHETELGLVMPLREISARPGGQPPYFEFQIALLKPCFDDGSGEMHDQIFTGEDGASLCLDPLVTFSTWADPLRHPNRRSRACP
jgi:hypothetical protein